MDILTNAAQVAVNFILSLSLWDVLDILVIAFLVYRLLQLVRRTNTSRLLKGVLVVGLVCWVILRLGLVTAAETQESVFLQFFSNFSWARG